MCLINVLKNKLFIILFFVFSFLFLLSINDSSSAFYSFSDPYDNTAYYTVPDLPTDKISRDSNKLFSFIVIGNDSGGNYFKLYDVRLIYGTVDSFSPMTSSSTATIDNFCFYLYSNNNASTSHYCDIYKSYFGDSSNSWEFISTNRNLNSFYLECNSSLDDKYLIYSNHVIEYLVKSSGGFPEVPFFLPPPQWGINLVQPLQVKQILPMVNKLTTILLPIGLAIFLMLLVVYLIASRKWFHI